MASLWYSPPLIELTLLFPNQVFLFGDVRGITVFYYIILS
jgi:hypothetical protein